MQAKKRERQQYSLNMKRILNVLTQTFGNLIFFMKESRFDAMMMMIIIIIDLSQLK